MSVDAVPPGRREFLPTAAAPARGPGDPRVPFAGSPEGDDAFLGRGMRRPIDSQRRGSVCCPSSSSCGHHLVFFAMSPSSPWLAVTNSGAMRARCPSSRTRSRAVLTSGDAKGAPRGAGGSDVVLTPRSSSLRVPTTPALP